MRWSLVFFTVSSLVLTGCVASSPPVPEIPAPSQQSSTITAEPVTPVVAAFDTTLHSIDDADSLWVVVDKLRRLTPKRYVPTGLRTLNVPHAYTPVLRGDAARAYLKMFRAARRQGIDLVFQSGYRSYSTQVSVYNGWVASIGRAAADLQSARPGYSEHQTALSVDIAAAELSRTPKITLEEFFGLPAAPDYAR